MQRAFERDEPMGMTVGFRRVRADEATGKNAARTARNRAG
jgi:hypothetical protein